ncbi:hypothetical protein FACS1894205_6100 [Alphaproteobacteria bacterium]|nr:hypothetical protein FACS1894205_6100 [Alphaproteobacteria bacterium]
MSEETENASAMTDATPFAEEGAFTITDPNLLEMINQASALKGISRAAFVNEIILHAAGEILDRSRPIILTAGDYEHFAACLSETTKLSPAMVELLHSSAPWEISPEGTRLFTRKPVKLSASHDVSKFSSGNAFFDRWLRTSALHKQEKQLSPVRVLVEDGRVIACYNVGYEVVVPEKDALLPGAGRWAHSVHCLFLSRLAVDSDWVGRGIGAGLVKDAISEALSAPGFKGIRAIVVAAENNVVAGFWRQLGFIPLLDDPHKLFCSIAALRDRSSIPTPYDSLEAPAPKKKEMDPGEISNFFVAEPWGLPALTRLEHPC